MRPWRCWRRRRRRLICAEATRKNRLAISAYRDECTPYLGLLLGVRASMAIIRIITRIALAVFSVFIGILVFFIPVILLMDDFVTEIPWAERAFNSLLPGIVGFFGGGIIGAIGAWVIGSIGVVFMGTGVGVPVALLTIFSVVLIGSAGGFLGFSLDSVFDFVAEPSKYQIDDGFYGLLLMSILIGIIAGYAVFKVLSKIIRQ